MNNLDPEVAERPDDLVVYGGTGKAARDWASFDAIVRTLTTLREDETLLVQSGRPVGVMRTHEWAPRVLHRQLQPRRRLGDLAGVPPARAARPDDVRPDDRRLVDLHRHAGHPAGHLRDVRRRRREALRRHARRHADAHRRLRRHGRRAAARRHAERRRVPGRRRRRDPAAPPGRAPLPRRGGRRPRRRGRAVPGRQAGRQRAVGRARRQRGAACSPSCCAAASRSTSSPTRPPRTTRCRYLPEDVDLADWHDHAADKPEEFTDRARASMARHVEAMVGFLDAGAEVFDYGNSIRDEARQGGYDRAFAFPGFVPAYIRPLFCEGKGPFRWAALSGDPTRHRRDRPGRPRPVPRQRPAAAVDPRRAGQGRLPGPAGPHLLARLRRARRGRPALQRHGRLGRAERAGRDRARPPRLRLGGLAVPRDRVDGRRLGRHRRLAAAQRDGQHGVGRVLGVDPPRRRRRHRPLDPRRPGQSVADGTPLAAPSSSAC